MPIMCLFMFYKVIFNGITQRCCCQMIDYLEASIIKFKFDVSNALEHKRELI